MSAIFMHLTYYWSIDIDPLANVTIKFYVITHKGKYMIHFDYNVKLLCYLHGTIYLQKLLFDDANFGMYCMCNIPIGLVNTSAH